jgi:hypothetical protein
MGVHRAIPTAVVPEKVRLAPEYRTYLVRKSGGSPLLIAPSEGVAWPFQTFGAYHRPFHQNLPRVKMRPRFRGERSSMPGPSSPLHFSGPLPHYSGPRAHFPDQSGSVNSLKSIDIHSGPWRNATSENVACPHSTGTSGSMWVQCAIPTLRALMQHGFIQSLVV